MKRYPLPFVNGLALVTCLVLATSRPAHAYLDPGTGSYALQLGLAGLFGALFSLKVFWRRIARRLQQSVTGAFRRSKSGRSDVHP